MLDDISSHTCWRVPRCASVAPSTWYRGREGHLHLREGARGCRRQQPSFNARSDQLDDLVLVHEPDLPLGRVHVDFHLWRETNQQRCAEIHRESRGRSPPTSVSPRWNSGPRWSVDQRGSRSPLTCRGGNLRSRNAQGLQPAPPVLPLALPGRTAAYSASSVRLGERSERRGVRGGVVVTSAHPAPSGGWGGQVAAAAARPSPSLKLTSARGIRPSDR